MGKFSKQPPSLHKTKQEFIEAAAEIQEIPEIKKTDKQKPWDKFDKKAPPKNTFNLRLNDYYMTLLRHLADQDEDLSMHKICKKILLPELERLAKTE